MINKYYNLDTLIEAYYDNVRVINILHRNGIRTLNDLYNCNINNVINSDSCGAKSKSIIEGTYYYLQILSKTDYDLKIIKGRYQYLMDKVVRVSPNSDNDELKGEVTFSRLIELYEETNMSPKDVINSNFIFKFLESYEGNSPLDYISKETAKFDSNKEAYKFLLEILNGFEEAKKDVFKKYYGICEKKHTLEEIGQEYGVTRERIRQINKNTTLKIYSVFDSHINKIVNTFNNNYYIPSNNPMLRIYCEYLYERGYYKQEIIFDEKTYVKDDTLIDIVKSIEYEIENNGVYCGNVDNLILRLFEKKYLVKNGKIFKNNNMSYYLPVILDELGRAVNLNSNNDVELLYDMLEKNYNITSEYKDARNLERVLSNICVLIDSRTFILEKYQKKADLDKVFEYIDRKEVTNAQQLYKIFLDIWNSIDIYSHVGVYGYMKYFYPEKYNYAGRSFLISVIGKSSTWGEIVIDLIKEVHEPVTFNFVNEMYPALNNTIWINLEANFKDLLLWSDNSYYCASLLNINEEESNFITVYIYNNGPILDRELYTYIFNNKKEILDKNYLHSEKQLLKFIKVKFNGMINYDSISKTYYI